jgi:GNAT superfamily N-acetyltransferase
MSTIIAPETYSTRSGIQLLIRPTTQLDEEQLIAFFDRVTDDDRRFRFLAASSHISHEQVKPLIHVDHIRSESFLAFETTGGTLVATGQLACDDALDTAEVAVSVRADYRGRGVGWTMLDLLASEAKRRGVRRVISIESRDNHAAIELEREKGFAPESLDGDPTLIVLSKTFR